MIMINTYHQIMCLPSSRKASVVEEVLKNFEIFCLSIACSDWPEINANRKSVKEFVQGNYRIFNLGLRTLCMALAKVRTGNGLLTAPSPFPFCPSKITTAQCERP